MRTPSLSRRQFIRQSVVFSAALMFGRRGYVLAADDISIGDHHLLVIGDWGADPKALDTNQHAVAEAMKGYVQAGKFIPEGIMFLGDNFYGDFPGGVNCPRWATQFEEMYPADMAAIVK